MKQVEWIFHNYVLLDVDVRTMYMHILNISILRNRKLTLRNKNIGP